MDRNLRLFYLGAKRMHLPVTFFSETGYLTIQLGKKNYYFTRGAPPLNNASSIQSAYNKFYCNKLLEDAGFSVPKAIEIKKESLAAFELSCLVKDLEFPLVIKPVKGTGRGYGVICNIKTIEDLAQFLGHFFLKFNVVQVEEFQPDLKEYRVLVLKNRVLGVVERFGAFVTGDGEHTISELIDIKNETRKRLSTSLTVSPLVYDEEYQLCLDEQGLSLEDIVPFEKKIRLCYTVNTGRGGEIISRGKKIHPENAKIVCAAAQSLGLEYAAMDVICEDINLPFNKKKWFILEINPWGDLTIHEVPDKGKKASVISSILFQLIKRHPFSYLRHLFLHSKWSLYSKIVLVIGAIFILISQIL